MIQIRHNSFTRITQQLIAIVLLVSTSAYAQEHDDQQQTTDLTTLNFFVPAIGYEKSIGQLSTLYGSFFLATRFHYWYSSNLGSETYFALHPSFTLQYRYYYNFDRRSERGKRTEMNSANYIAPVIFTVFTNEALFDNEVEEDNRRAVTSVGAVWGLQRNGRKRFSLNLNLGLGFTFTKGTRLDENGNREKVNHQYFSTIGSLSLGFWINKRK